MNKKRLADPDVARLAEHHKSHAVALLQPTKRDSCLNSPWGVNHMYTSDSDTIESTL